MDKTMNKELPIQNLECFDILGRRKDGGVDMVIVVSSKLMDTEEHKMLFMQKLQNYVNESRSDEFIKEFGAGPYRIITKLTDRPDDSFFELFEKSKIFLESIGIEFGFEYV